MNGTQNRYWNAAPRLVIWSPRVRLLGGITWLESADWAGPMNAPPAVIRQPKPSKSHSGGWIASRNVPVAPTTPNSPNRVSARAGLRPIRRSTYCPPIEPAMMPTTMRGMLKKARPQTPRPYFSESR